MSNSEKYAVVFLDNKLWLTCSSCLNDKFRMEDKYCYACQCEKQRKYKQNYISTPEGKKKSKARSYAQTYLKRGKIKRNPCAECGANYAEMHHHDYEKPLDIKWLCKSCHVHEHRVNEKIVHLKRALMAAKST